VRAECFDVAGAQPFSFLIGIGTNSVRAKLFNRWSAFGQPTNFIHPFTWISPSASLGLGLAIMPGAVINAASKIHDNAIINTRASIDHHCVIGAHAHICPGVTLAGDVSVGCGTMIGVGSSVIPGVRIGENCLIGAGSTVVRDIPNHSVAFGTPARVVRENEKFDFTSLPPISLNGL
jgi:sugar O-acyltransferase (sialic acid O-acetyltransferase NeuD family)